MASPSVAYRPRRPAQSVLYQVVRDHLETFCLQSATLRGGEGLPRFVEEEFRAYLRCGWLAGGFARFRCAACGADRLVAFSCKGRGFCPSCGARRMAWHTVHLVDHVFPPVAVRQWVLSLPHHVRYQLAWDHALCKAVVGVFLRAVLGFLRTRAVRDGIADGRGGGVAMVQRFGAALNLNVHVHALVLDGVFTRGPSARPVFRETARISDADVEAVLHTVARRIVRVLGRRGYGVDADGFALDGWAEEVPALAGMGAASVLGRAASGPRAGARTRRVAAGPDTPREDAAAPRCHARLNGFDLHAGVVAPAGHRHRLERLCRYGLRPPVAEDRLRLTADGQVLLRLRHPWTDGTTHLLFEPTELLERLAVLTPRPRVNLILYYGVLAPRAVWRAEVVGEQPALVQPASVRDGGGHPDAAAVNGHGGAAHPPDPPARSWAALMRRVFAFDVLACPRCGRAMRLIALIEHPDIVRRILRHLGEATEVPAPAPARPPPLDREDADGPTAWSEEPDAVSRGFLEPAADDPC